MGKTSSQNFLLKNVSYINLYVLMSVLSFAVAVAIFLRFADPDNDIANAL